MFRRVAAPARRWSVLLTRATFVLLVLGFPGVGAAQEGTSPRDLNALLPTPVPLPAGEARAEGPLAVVATTGILADLVHQVGGPRVAVRSLLPANADPHDFEPKPEDLVAVETAALVIRHGLGLDEWVTSLIESAGGGVPVVMATEGITTLNADATSGAQGDPHVWFDPTRTAIMVDNIANALIQADPAGETTYRERAAAYQGDLAALDGAIQTAIATIPPERRKMVTNHDALAYFADRYGLTIVGTVIPGLDTTAEPSAKEVATLLEVIEREGVSVIFAENTTNPTLAQALATEAGVTIVVDLYTDSLGEPGSGADTYLGLMRTDTVTIVEALR